LREDCKKWFIVVVAAIVVAHSFRHQGRSFTTGKMYLHSILGDQRRLSIHLSTNEIQPHKGLCVLKFGVDGKS